MRDKFVNTFYTTVMQTKQSQLIKQSFVEMMKDVATSTPGHILAFDSTTQLAQVQVGIVRVSATGETFDVAPIVECPVYFAGGGGFVLEHQIDPQDEGVILFSQRCIDGWRETGGVAQNPIARFHDINDAMFLPGMRSKPNAVKSFGNDGMRIRNDDASAYIWLKSDGTAEITVSTLTINGAIVHTGETTHTGNVTVTGVATSASIVTGSLTSAGGGALTSDVTIETTGDFVAGTVSLKTHTHPYSWTDPAGSGTTGTPT